MLLIANWGLVLSTICYASLGVWRIAIAREHRGAFYLGVAFLGMSAWSGAMLYDSARLVAIAEVVRDLSWLLYIFSTIHASDQYDEIIGTVRRFIVVISALVIIRLVLSLDLSAGGGEEGSGKYVVIAMLATRWFYALFGILFAQYLFRITASRSGSGFRLIIVALGIIWAFNLNLFSLWLLGFSKAYILSDLRGVLNLLLLPAFVLAARRRQNWKLALSRQATTQSVLFIALGSYFVFLAAATRALSIAGQYATDISRPIFYIILISIVTSLVFLPKLRENLKFMLIKNLYEHRYDYRIEWLRFSTTISDDTSSGLSAEERMIRAVVDITESRGGALLVAEGGGRLRVAGLWQWPASASLNHSLPANPSWLKQLGDEGNTLPLDELRKEAEKAESTTLAPDWILAEPQVWAIVPLVKSGDLIGIILLGRPALDRDLDWEDLDLLKVIGRQVAVHLTDAYGQRELEEARRYEEFNKRFAFIIHDLKNVVSQLSLVSVNAEEHIANPKFQAAMVRTLENATSKMTKLLSRLSTNGSYAGPKLADVQLEDLLFKLAREVQPSGSIRVSIERACSIRADEELLSEALSHLLRNGIEASPPAAEVFLSLSVYDDMAVIVVEDHGCGMTPEFIHTQLFKPFSSTKKDGFGIGAAEARDLIRSMDGELEVMSVVGEGTRFLATFPLAPRADSGSI